MQFDVWGHTDRGRRRHENQDSLLFSLVCDEGELPIVPISADSIRTHGHLIAVADGVGGLRGGREASQLLAKHLSNLFYKLARNDSVEELLSKAIVQANINAAEQNQQKNASSTLVAAVVRDDRLHVGHVGDSRAYLIRNGKMQQLTQDHALGNRLTRYLVSTTEYAPTMQPPIKLQAGDWVLLCSDGLYREVTDSAEIITILQNNRAEDAAHRLIALADANGGNDNISVALLHAFERRNERGRWESL